MAHPIRYKMRWLGLATLAAATVLRPHVAVAQTTGPNNITAGLIPLLGSQPAANTVTAAPLQQQPGQRRVPFGRLIENPDQTDGAPPFALTDQTGTIQRYVEPVAGIDLAAHVGQVVVLRHDTGGTLLASQIELPAQTVPRRLRMNEDRYAINVRAAGAPRHEHEFSGEIEQVQYVDNDDSTVQLLPDDTSVPNGMARGSSAMMPLEGVGPDGEMSGFGDSMGSGGMNPGPYCQPYGPMPDGPGGFMPNSGPMVAPCPNCGPYQNGMIGDGIGAGASCADAQPNRARLSAAVDLLLLRPQVAEGSIGKLSEDYQFSPRVILGVRGVGNIEGRIRYWHYGKDSDVLDGNGDVKFKFDSLDIEALHRFKGARSELALSAGVRLAGIHLKDTDDEECGADFIGLTLAADGLSPLGLFPRGHFGLVYGGRLSILGGDWGGDDNSLFINHQVRNDNVLVHELYAGVELARQCGIANVHARLLFEMQNWRSDALSGIADIESIGFFGPGLELGAEF